MYQSTILGSLPHTKGKEADFEKYGGGSIFYDVASTSQAALPYLPSMLSNVLPTTSVSL
jgi:hypothetical protein